MQSVIANLAKPGERGQLLGAMGSMTELTGAIGSILFASILGKFAGDGALLGGKLPGMHFLVGSALLLAAWGFAAQGFLIANKDHPALMGCVVQEKDL